MDMHENIPDFTGLFEAELLQELSGFDIKSFEKNDQLLNEGAYIKAVPLLLEGRIKVRKADQSGKEIILYFIEPGESCILTITSCLNEKESKAEAVAVENVRLILIPSSRLREWMNTFPTWQKFVYNLYYLRMAELLNLVDQIAFQQLDLRLLKKLKDKQESYGNELSLTHQQLANELGTAREVVTRLLNNLEKDGSIELGRGKIIVKRLL